MSLLELNHISKFYRLGARLHTALDDVSLEIDSGELVAVWGLRHSGRTTLLRLAAGIEAPDSGTVRFAGRDLNLEGVSAVGSGIAYCQRRAGGPTVREELIAAALALGVPPSLAKARAWASLERAGALHAARLAPVELEKGDAVRVMIARALASRPRLMLIDEPTTGVDLLHRDGILQLIRSLATDGIAILMSVGESTGLFGADRALSLNEGEMHGHVTPELAAVVHLPRRVIA